MGEGRELRVIHAFFETGNSGAVDPDEVSGIFHSFTESNGGLSDTCFGRSGLRLVIHIDRVFQLIALQDLQEAFSVRFSGGSSHAVLSDKVISADWDTGSLRTFVICFPFAVRIKTGIGAASFDDGKLDTGLFDLIPVNGSLPMTDVDSFSRHVIFPPHRDGRGAAPRPPLISPVPAGRGVLRSPSATDLHWTGRRR